jgi:Skp family chaperone for outer membrane proteins
MKRTGLAGALAGVAVGLVAVTVTQSIHAQTGGAALTGRIACVDVVQVFNEFQRQKDLTEEMKELQDKLTDENKQRRQKIDALQAELDKLDPDDATYVTRMREMLAMQIDYKNWVDLKQADMSREIGVWSVRIYKEIVKAVAELAKRDGYDLVLYRGQFEPTSMEPDQVKEQIRSNHLLYANPSIDITQVVTDKLNKDYRAQPRVKMMLVP